MSLGTEAVESLPKPHSPSAHSQCYATANYFHSALTKPWRGGEKGREGKKRGKVGDKIDSGEERRQDEQEESQRGKEGK